MKPFSQPQQRQHGVVDGCQMSPQVKQSVPARCYFPQDLLGRERSKKLVRPIDLGLPCFQPESCERRVVSHASISCQLMGVEPLTNIREARSSSRAPSTIPRCPTRFWRRRQRHRDGNDEQVCRVELMSPRVPPPACLLPLKGELVDVEVADFPLEGLTRNA